MYNLQLLNAIARAVFAMSIEDIGENLLVSQTMASINESLLLNCL